MGVFPHRWEFLPNSTDTTDSEKAILEKLVKWKDNRVNKSVEHNNQKLILLQWVYSPRIVNGNKKTKAQLEAKAYQEGNNSKSDFLGPALKNVYVSSSI